MLWEVEIHPGTGEIDREGERVRADSVAMGVESVNAVRTARSFLLEGDLASESVDEIARRLLADTVAESFSIHQIVSHPVNTDSHESAGGVRTVLYKPGVTDNVAESTRLALAELGYPVQTVATGRKYWFEAAVSASDLERITRRILANDAIERVIVGPLHLSGLSVGTGYRLNLVHVPLRALNDAELVALSRTQQLYLSLAEMQTVQRHFHELGRDPTDIELETVAQTWSEHCSHKTLKGRIRYRDESGEVFYENMLKETIFAATQKIRAKLGVDDWCVSVFEDNAGVVKFNDRYHVCFKVETHNHPSAIEPYGGANTGLGGVIRDPLGTGLGAKPICNSDVFCFAPPDTPHDQLPPGVLHPMAVAKGVVAGVRDYGNRMGIPTVNGSVFFDDRYLGNPLVFCGTAALIPVSKSDKSVQPGDFIVTVGGRTGRDGIHGATFSSVELTQESEGISGGSVQIGNAVMEKMVMDVILQARDRGLYRAITDCGAGGFSSAVGEMGEKTGAEVWLEKAPLKYMGLSYTDIWISEAQERMVLAVPPESSDEFLAVCAAEGVEATVIGRFASDGQLRLTYNGTTVGQISMSFLHDGRPPVVRDAVYQMPPATRFELPSEVDFTADLLKILGSLNVCSKEWIIRQYDHEVQAGSVVKPLVGTECDGPSDAAIVRPDLSSSRGVVLANGMNPHFGDLDPYWMAIAAVDEAIRNAVAVGSNPDRIAVLDNFCWGNTERPETLGSLVRAARGCHDAALAYGTPFISGKDSLNNEFSYVDSAGQKLTVAIPSTLLVSAIGQIDDVAKAVTMDAKSAGNMLYLVGETRNEMGGSHLQLVRGQNGGEVPQVDLNVAPQIYRALHVAIEKGYVASCHDLSEGGLAVAAAEMAFAGGLGIELDLQSLGVNNSDRHPALLLFSESPSRFLVEVPPYSSRSFEDSFDELLPLMPIGEVVAEQGLRIFGENGVKHIDVSHRTMKNAWISPLAW